MSFFAYVIAWIIILSFSIIISYYAGKIGKFIVNSTPLRNVIISKNKEYYTEIAKCIVEEMKKEG